MKQFDLKEYTPILELTPYTIYEHPKTFHHVMVYGTQRGGVWEREQVAQWNMPGLATDGPVVVPPGFMRGVIKKLGVGGGKKKVVEVARDVEPDVAPMQYYRQDLNWANVPVARRWDNDAPGAPPQAPPPRPRIQPGELPADAPGRFLQALDEVERDIQEIRRLRVQAENYQEAPAPDVEF